MKIRKYKQHPEIYVPDVGEVIQARRSGADAFLPAVVVRVRRLANGHVRVTVQWLASNPRAGAQAPAPIKAGDTGRIVFPPERASLLIRQTSRDAPATD